MLGTIKEELSFSELNPEEKKSRGILGRLTGPIASFKESTRNGRLYTESLWEKAFQNDIVQEMFNNGGLIGQLEHPEGTTESDPMKAAILMREPPKKDKHGHLIASVDILDTPCGQIAYALSKAGFKFGISSRGEGDVETGYDGQEIVNPDTYELTTFDIVALPACKDARLQFTESVNKKFDYKKYLSESMKKATKDERKIMQETINKVKSKLSEDDELDTVKEEEPVSVGYFLIKDADGNVINGLSDASIEEVKDYIDGQDFEEVDEEEFTKYFDLESGEELEIGAEEGGLEEIEDSEIEDDGLITSDEEEVEDEESDEDITQDGVSHRGGHFTNESVDNNEEALIDELQESLKTNKKLQDTIHTLNEKLSVCYAKENEQNNNVKLLSESRREIATLKNQLANVTKELEKTQKDSKSLTESINKRKDSEIAQLKESLSGLKKDIALSESNRKKKAEESQKLVEKYKKVANTAVDKYIDSQAKLIGVSVNEIKQKLPESYSFKDIDAAVADVQRYTVSTSRLPFSTSLLNEDIKAGVRPSKSKSNFIVRNEDDSIDNDLLSLAGMR